MRVLWWLWIADLFFAVGSKSSARLNDRPMMRAKFIDGNYQVSENENHGLLSNEMMYQLNAP